MDSKKIKKLGEKSEYHHLPIFDGLELLNAKYHTLDFPFHTHETFNIALILNTTFNTKLSDKFLKAPIGTLSITNPKEVHATPCDQDLGNSFFTYYVSPEVIKELNGGQFTFFEDRIIYDQNIFNELYFLSNNLYNKTVDFEKRLGIILRNLVLKYAAVRPISYNSSKFFQNFINETSFENFSLEKTALQFGIDKYKFIRLFKQETGLTPNNFAIMQKIEQSKGMLKTGKPILDVAIDCGFYDTSHFYKNFKRFVGVNPISFQNTLFID
ncbi:AraC family transcriptional regulator [Bernardetia sp. Wsw4-3y2]|uniref:AraC family transcriptional regulator n=1 Tax=Bernardetia sp. Wsw4-3y2 TaxID=3127471 RepID=UPI0030CEDF17